MAIKIPGEEAPAAPAETETQTITPEDVGTIDASELAETPTTEASVPAKKGTSALASMFESMLGKAEDLPEMASGGKPYLQTLSFAGNNGAERKELADSIGVSEGALILRSGNDGVTAAGLAFVLLKGELYYGIPIQGEGGWGFSQLTREDKSEGDGFEQGWRRIFPYVMLALPAKDELPEWAGTICVLRGHFTKQHAQAMGPVITKMRSAQQHPDKWLQKYEEHAGVPVYLRVAFGLTGKMKPGKKGQNAFATTTSKVYPLGMPQAKALKAAEDEDDEATADEIRTALEWLEERKTILDALAADPKSKKLYCFDSGVE